MQQPKNRVSHVVYCFRPENFDSAAEFLTNVLGAKFEDSSRPELGLRILISLENGLELISPSPDIGAVGERFTRFLDEHYLMRLRRNGSAASPQERESFLSLLHTHQSVNTVPRTTSRRSPARTIES